MFGVFLGVVWNECKCQESIDTCLFQAKTDQHHPCPMRNRSVLVWGFGNAAHETARELQKYTQAAFGWRLTGRLLEGSETQSSSSRGALFVVFLNVAKNLQ